ncbi:sugar phosphate exchanger 3-like [Diadema antillarum]|uniref:sugar phosphate exchanger 3-like n=1 Tax=Diadema antillarum TaxID=105358 RepID=UPI003A8A0A56
MNVRRSVEQLLPLLVNSSSRKRKSRPESRVPSPRGVEYWALRPAAMGAIPERYQKTLTRNHALVFFLTFFAYVFIHAARKTFSNVKTALAETWTLLPLNETIFLNSSEYLDPEKDPFLDSIGQAEVFFGILDTVFLVSYALGLFISGIMGDRIDLRLVLSFGMCSSALMMFIFGTLSEWVKVYNHWYYLVFWVLNGLLQGTGWPTLVAIMGNWFSEGSRGLVFGVWSACGSIGNMLGAFSASLVLSYGYEFTFLVTSMMMFFWGLVILFFLMPTPRDAGVEILDSDEGKPEKPAWKDSPSTQDKKPIVDDVDHVLSDDTTTNEESSSDEEEQDEQESDKKEKAEAIGFCNAFLLPGVACYSCGYACLKLVNYTLFNWIPYYLTSKFQWQEVSADRLSMAYDLGGIIGGTIGGVISDFMGIRSPVVIVMLFGSMASLYGYNATPANYALNAFVMAVLGTFVCGVAHIISATVAADLGQQGPMRQDKEALATVTGIVDGTGTIGAAIGQVIVPVLYINYDWFSVFGFLILTTAMSVILISPILIKEIRSLRSK